MVKEGGALGLGVKREKESTNMRAHKMMKGKVEPSCSVDSGKGKFNSGTCSQTNHRDTIDDSSIGDTIKGVEVRGTNDDICARDIIEGARNQTANLIPDD
jgi:hypothetical protein